MEKIRHKELERQANARLLELQGVPSVMPPRSPPVDGPQQPELSHGDTPNDDDALDDDEDTSDEDASDDSELGPSPWDPSFNLVKGGLSQEQQDFYLQKKEEVKQHGYSRSKNFWFDPPNPTRLAHVDRNKPSVFVEKLVLFNPHLFFELAPDEPPCPSCGFDGDVKDNVCTSCCLCLCYTLHRTQLFHV